MTRVSAATAPSTQSKHQNERHDARHDERGYVMAMTALLLVPLLIFAALAVDVGAWTVQANRAQSAADAAALAGTPLLPDQGKAATVARDVAAQNGFVHGVDGTTVDIEFPDNQTIRVIVTEDSQLHFSSIVIDEPFDVSRFADASAISPITMGSPTNVLGFGPYSLDGSQVANYWILENNDCQPAHFGDGLAAKFLGSPWCGVSNSAPLNPRWKRASDGRDGGYFYVVTIPPDLNVSSRLMVFDPGKCKAFGDKPGDPQHNNAGKGTEMKWRMWDTNQTPLVSSDDVALQHDGNVWWDPNGQPGSCADDILDTYNNAGQWQSTDTSFGWMPSPFVFPPNNTTDDQTYLIQTRVKDSTVAAWNYHAYWIRPEDGSFDSCLSIGSTSCPSIGAESWIGTGARGVGNGNPMELYLAEIGPEHEGKTMKALLWDVGEHMDNIQIIDPLGNSLDFTWDADDNQAGYGSGNPSDTCGSNPCLDLRPDFSKFPKKLPYSGWSNSWRFNGRTVTVNVPLDKSVNPTVDFPNYAASGNGYWFRIRFIPQSNKEAKEWATFSLQITGDPIRLVD